MGAPTDMLVVVATMYDNPQGLTKEQVLDKFNKIKLKGPLGIRDYLTTGLQGFSKLFNLEHTEKYLKNRENYWNEDYKYFSKREILLRDYFYGVVETSHNSIGKTEMNYESVDSSEFGENIFEGHKVGEHVWQGHFTEIRVPEEFKDKGYSFIVRKILDNKTEKEDFWAKVNETLEVEVVEFDSKKFEFDSLQKLWESYPEYYPENTHNFNQETGFLYPHEAYGIKYKNPSFRWIKKGEKYFLDFEHFSKILNANSYFGRDGWNHSGQKNKSTYSLMDIVLTSEAIRRRNWRKLGYNAFFGDNESFIFGNERTLKRYEKAVLETELAVEAQKKGWSNLEFLREYNSRIVHKNKVSYEDIKKMFKEENKRRGIEKRKNTIKRKEEEAERDKNEQDLPF